MAIDYNPLFATVDRATLDAFRKQSVSAETTAMTAVITVVVVLFGLFFAFSAIAAEADGEARPERIALIVGVAVTVGIVAFFVFRAVARASALRRYRITTFAVRNGMLYSTTPRPPTLEGVVFRVGKSRAVYERLWRDTDNPIELGNYRYTTGSGKNKSTHHWSYLAIRLPRRLPHMLLDAKGNNSLFGSNLPVSLDRDQRLSLEGDFDTHFTLYCPREYETDALYVFTPDLMALLIDEAAKLDVEIVDDWMLVYSHAKLDLSNPHQLSRLLRVVDTVGRKARSRSSRYADDRILGDAALNAPAATEHAIGAARLSHNLIAPAGRRLTSGTPWLMFGLVGVAIIAWLLLRVIGGV